METDRPTYRGVKQRGQILEYKNFDYRKHQTDGNRVYYRCAERNKYGCKATLAIGKETGIVRKKVRDAAIGANPEKGKRRSLDRVARREELTQLVSNYANIPMKEYTNFVLAYYNTNI